jgi:small subunit ribosomal protein S4
VRIGPYLLESRIAVGGTAEVYLAKAATVGDGRVRHCGPLIVKRLLPQSLERRLDNVIFRVGFSTSRAQARQLVRHGHFTINGKRVDIPSYAVRQGDTVGIRQGSVENASIKHAMEEVKGRGVPEWLTIEASGQAARISSLPSREQINLPVQEQLIVELYSK